MNKKVIKELQKLLALCMEINEKTEHQICMSIDKNTDTFDVYEPIKAENVFTGIDWIAMSELITLPNINKCKQKLLKYKEW